MARRTLIALAAAVLVAGFAVSYVDGVVDGIARSNLSNAAFWRAHLETPADYGIPYEPMDISSDGLRLSAWWMPGPPGHPNATTAVVLVPGLGSNMSKVVRQWAPNLHAAGYSLLSLDLRNHGASADGPDGYVSYGDLESRDIVAGAAALRDQAPGLGIDPDRIVLYGESMAASSALMAARPTGAAAVIADSSFASFPFEARLDGAAQGYPGFVIGWVLARMDALSPGTPTRVRASDALADLDIPVLLAHCSNDEKVSVRNLDELRRSVTGRASVWVQECPLGPSETHHVDGWAQPGYNQTVLQFLDDALNPG